MSYDGDGMQNSGRSSCGQVAAAVVQQIDSGAKISRDEAAAGAYI